MTRWLDAARQPIDFGTQLTKPTEPNLDRGQGPANTPSDCVSSVVSVLSGQDGRLDEPADTSSSSAHPGKMTRWLAAAREDDAAAGASSAISRVTASKMHDIDHEPYRHGRAVNGNPRTWTGRVVSLEEWRRLSDWERDGSTGKVWNALTRQWEP